MNLELEEVDELAIIRLPDSQLTRLERDGFKTEMINIIGRGYRFFILDLSAVRFIDISALGAILSLLNTIGPNGRMVVCGLNHLLEDVFRLTNLNRVIEIQPDLAHARQALQAD
ncbi:STAS domain-containing protein [Thiocapsa imhoffii]|uniref:STAS domain-containing protein n=1 Tax=Thiocapsa imhoffii TaxID=382777 RepID=UPI0019072D5B|nr:STAS domain-containing protein [Thiocapsa imhoffii]